MNALLGAGEPFADQTPSAELAACWPVPVLARSVMRVWAKGERSAVATSLAVRREFVRDTLVQAVGTVIGGLLLLGCLKFGGLFGEVEWAAVGKSVALGIVVAYALIRIGIRMAEGALTLHQRVNELKDRFYRSSHR